MVVAAVSAVEAGSVGCRVPTLTYATSTVVVGHLASFGLPWRRRAGCQVRCGVTRMRVRHNAGGI